MGVRGRTNWSRRELVPDGDVSLPRRRFASFAAAGKGGRPAGRNPVRRRAGSPRPTDVMVRGGRAGLGPAPTAIHGHSRDMAGGKLLPYGVAGKHPPAGRPQRAAPTASQVGHSRTGGQRAEKLTPASASDTALYSWPRRRPPPPASRCRPQSRRRRPPRGPGR